MDRLHRRRCGRGRSGRLPLLQTLADADSWSSIGAFLTALITVVVSAGAWVFHRGADAGSAPGARRRWTAFNWGNQVVINGDRTNNRIGSISDD